VQQSKGVAGRQKQRNKRNSEEVVKEKQQVDGEKEAWTEKKEEVLIINL